MNRQALDTPLKNLISNKLLLKNENHYIKLRKISNLYNSSSTGYNINNNYQLSSGLTTGNIFQRYLKATFTGLNKVYNALTQGQSTYTISGIYSGDIIDISNIYLTNFSDRFVGNNKPVYITNASLIGSNYFNYIIDSSAIAFNANITPKLLTSNFYSLGKVYDRNNQKCFDCDCNIERIVQNQRSSFYCKICQK